MLKNYFIIAIRTLLRNRVFSLINIFGLAVSMSVCLLVIMIVTEQYSTDRSNPSKDRIYRVNTYREALGNSSKFASSALPIAAELASITSVVETTTIRDRFRGDADTGKKIVPISGIYAERNFFKFFNSRLVSGNVATALSAPFSIVLTQKAADKLYSPGEKVLGRTLLVGDYGEFTITGILQVPSTKSHVDGFEIIASSSTLPILEDQEIIRPVTTKFDRYYLSYVYCLLKDNVNPETITPHLANIVKQHYSDDENIKIQLSLQPLTAINPAMTELSNELYFSMPFIAIIFISGLAFLIMLTATFNYTSLSIAKGLSRLKEIGIRKVSGANKGQVYAQFIVESVITSLFALVLAYIILQFIKPWFFQIDSHIEEFITLKDDLLVWSIFVGFAIFVGILAGSLPAILLSRLKANQILKGSGSIKLLSNLNFRKVLIVLQFALSLIFITTAIILDTQFNFALNYDLGFDRQNILHVELQNNEFQTTATELGRVSGVEEIAGLGYVMGVGRLYNEFLRNPDKPDSINTAYQPITPNYLTNMKHVIMAGVNFPAGLNDSLETFIILNETAVRELQLGDVHEAIGQQVIISGDEEVEVVAVVKDFHYGRIDNPIGAFAFRYIPTDFRVLNMRLNGNNLEQTMAGLEVAWSKLDNVHEFDYQFYDEQIEEAYGIFKMMNYMIGFIAFLAITISVLGLLGMVTYSTQSRLKEIGIRKVLGAEIPGLVWLLSKGFGTLLLIAIVLAVPLTLFINKAWMDSMANRAPIGFWDITGGILIMSVLGLLAVVSQTFITSLQNPADTLRDE